LETVTVYVPEVFTEIVSVLAVFDQI
jgi:hypothetical protein